MRQSQITSNGISRSPIPSTLILPDAHAATKAALPDPLLRIHAATRT